MDNVWNCWSVFLSYILDCLTIYEKHILVKASGIEWAQQIRDLIDDIIHFGKFPVEWEESIIVYVYKGNASLHEEIIEASNC